MDVHSCEKVCYHEHVYWSMGGKYWRGSFKKHRIGLVIKHEKAYAGRKGHCLDRFFPFYIRGDV
jgi:hypothetical protein